MRLRAAAGVGLAQLRHDRARTALAVAGVALAVLATTLLAGVGVGVLETGEDRFEQSGRDLWITGGPVQLAPGAVGSLETTVTDAHHLGGEVSAREEVRTAVPMSFQTVYAGTDPDDVEPIVGVGVPGTGGDRSISLAAGEGFRGDDVHYADGRYDGPWTHEVIVGPGLAERLDVGVGDRLYVGGTATGAREHSFEVVGISSTFSGFLGTSTVVVRLSELQDLTGTAAADRATLVTVDLASGADADAGAVAADLRESYPGYEVRTNREQLEAILADQALVLASGVVLVLLSVLAGIALTVNLLVLYVYQQRPALAAARAIGVSAEQLVATVLAQGLALATLGGLVGVALTYPGAVALDRLAARVAGFEDLVVVTPEIVAAGVGVALVTGLAGALLASWRAARVAPLAVLRDRG